MFLSDTRTNAGVDNVGTYRKQHVIAPGPRRLFVIESAGNLATTQEVLDRIRRDLHGDGESLASVNYLFEAALYIGRVSRQVVAEHQGALSGFDATATLILGGQIEDEAPEILMVYPEGNYIRGPMSCRSCRSARRSTGSFCSRWPPRWTWTRRPRRRSHSDR